MIVVLFKLLKRIILMFCLSIVYLYIYTTIKSTTTTNYNCNEIQPACKIIGSSNSTFWSMANSTWSSPSPLNIREGIQQVIKYARHL